VDPIAVLLTGLLAGGVSCAAVQGGLLAGLITRQRTVAASAGLAQPTSPRRPEPSRRGALVDDLVPVGGFLAGKLVSHTLLGALLGALGSVVQLSMGVRTTLQLVAGALIIAFGLAQLGAPGFRRLVIEPPASWARLVLRSSRSQAAFAPALLGVASVLIPCGVTLSVEALALASGSPLGGAAIMAVFVIGTSPLFALLGYAARKAATVWRGRLAAATGVLVVLMGLYTLNGGLELAGSPLAASRLVAAAAPAAPSAPSGAGPATTADGRQIVTITARSGEYAPDTLTARAGVPTTLVIRSERAQGCVRSFVIPSLGVEQILPVSGETRIELGSLPPGVLAYSCGMGMYTGTINAA